MTTTQLVTITVIFAVIVLLQADYQAARFKANKPISHIGKATIYCLLCAAIGLCFIWGRWNEYYWYWELPLLAGFQRLAIFDLILNATRKDKWYYVGRGTTGSLQSKIEGQLSDTWVKVLKVVFVVMWGTVIVLIIKGWI